MAGAADAADTPNRQICDYCGDFIDDPGQRCAALDNGRCEA
jgi:hypothetical protein